MWVTREELLESEMVRQSLLDDGVYYARKIKDWELSYEAMKNGNKMCHDSILQKDAKIQMLTNLKKKTKRKPAKKSKKCTPSKR